MRTQDKHNHALTLSHTPFFCEILSLIFMRNSKSTKIHQVNQVWLKTKNRNLRTCNVNLRQTQSHTHPLSHTFFLCNINYNFCV